MATNIGSPEDDVLFAIYGTLASSRSHLPTDCHLLKTGSRNNSKNVCPPSPVPFEASSRLFAGPNHSKSMFPKLDPQGHRLRIDFGLWIINSFCRNLIYGMFMVALVGRLVKKTKSLTECTVFFSESPETNVGYTSVCPVWTGAKIRSKNGERFGAGWAQQTITDNCCRTIHFGAVADFLWQLG